MIGFPQAFIMTEMPGIECSSSTTFIWWGFILDAVIWYIISYVFVRLAVRVRGTLGARQR